MGVPVVTCAGETFASRHGLAHLTAAGAMETIARDTADYVYVAVSLANDLPRLAALRAGLRERVAASPLCDGPRFARNFGRLMREVWQRWVQEGDPLQCRP
jgi:predicted O-linked N-acetylglucosamine transferase (SPINDLY family)